MIFKHVQCTHFRRGLRCKILQGVQRILIPYQQALYSLGGLALRYQTWPVRPVRRITNMRRKMYERCGLKNFISGHIRALYSYSYQRVGSMQGQVSLQNRISLNGFCMCCCEERFELRELTSVSNPISQHESVGLNWIRS